MNRVLVMVSVVVGVVLSGLFVSENMDFASQTIHESTIVIPKESYVLNSGLTFDPEEVTVVVGVNNTVRWINQETTPVFINSMDGSWTQIKINPNDSEFMLFTDPGIYEYFGHPWMQGRVIVLDTDDSESKLQP